jgi:hypothetical protein
LAAVGDRRRSALTLDIAARNQVMSTTKSLKITAAIDETIPGAALTRGA